MPFLVCIYSYGSLESFGVRCSVFNVRKNHFSPYFLPPTSPGKRAPDYRLKHNSITRAQVISFLYSQNNEKQEQQQVNVYKLQFLEVAQQIHRENKPYYFHLYFIRLRL